ncbi:hypothetical protein AVEN_72277-1 [Araneus ventricosus]|uniref:Uncharacterized protein n=1 Tax=Araneus ventricosus TaxID=182803 RepID=A0A4Y2SNT3_ARAVE|nr:hypothetical protein AVEN_72277-1 [Araneus ventricosus]
MQGGFEQFAEYLRICHKELACENYNHNDLEKVSYNPNFIKHSDVIESTTCESLAKEVLSTTKIKLPTLTNSADLNVRLQAERQKKVATRAASSKRETMTASSKRETASLRKASHFKRETPGRDSKQKVTNTVSKQKTTEAPTKREITETVSQRCPDSDSQTNNLIEQKTHLEWFENIVRTVVEYNNSKNSDPAVANNQIQRETDKFLKELKNMIKSLIDVLEDSDEE